MNANSYRQNLSNKNGLKKAIPIPKQQIVSTPIPRLSSAKVIKSKKNIITNTETKINQKRNISTQESPLIRSKEIILLANETSIQYNPANYILDIKSPQDSRKIMSCSILSEFKNLSITPSDRKTSPNPKNQIINRIPQSPIASKRCTQSIERDNKISSHTLSQKIEPKYFTLNYSNLRRSEDMSNIAKPPIKSTFFSPKINKRNNNDESELTPSSQLDVNVSDCIFELNRRNNFDILLKDTPENVAKDYFMNEKLLQKKNFLEFKKNTHPVSPFLTEHTNSTALKNIQIDNIPSLMTKTSFDNGQSCNNNSKFMKTKDSTNENAFSTLNFSKISDYQLTNPDATSLRSSMTQKNNNIDRAIQKGEMDQKEKTMIENLISPRNFFRNTERVITRYSKHILGSVFSQDIQKRMKCSCEINLKPDDTCSRAIKWLKIKYKENEFTYLQETYRRLYETEVTKDCLIQIQKDLTRTFPTNKYFTGESKGY